MPALAEDEYYAELKTLTGMGEQDWRDFVSLPPEMQMDVVKTYRDASWATSPDVLAKVVAACALIGAIAGTVSGVAGAAGAVAALKTLAS